MHSDEYLDNFAESAGGKEMQPAAVVWVSVSKVPKFIFKRLGQPFPRYSSINIERHSANQ